MYSQYQQYRQPTPTVTQQPGMVLNGGLWASQHTPTNITVQQSSTPVETYTAYYNGWKAKEQLETVKADTLQGEQKAEAQRQAAWAKYYADQSSVAAHHFHSSPNVTFPHGDLPPAPPKPSTSQYQPQQQKTNQVHQQQHDSNIVTPTPKQQPHQSPESLKRYVHRCLERCTDKNELAQMQKLVEESICAALHAGTMHTINWDTKELIPMIINRSKYTTQPTSMPIQIISNTACSGYYGPSSSLLSTASSNYHGHIQAKIQRSSGVTSNKSHQSKPQRNDSDNSNYYGRSTTAHSYRVDNSDELPLSNNYLPLPIKEAVSKKLSVKKATKLTTTLALAKAKVKIATAKKKRVFEDVLGFQQSNSTMAKRANRFAGAGGILEASSVTTSLNGDYAKYMGKIVIGGSTKGDLDEDDYVRMTVKGTCVKLEKEYLRLTAPPKAELVRPQGILEQHLQNLQKNWSERNRDYVWICSQLKAIRQDMTVQRIFNGFAIQVYETHGRIALEQGDLNEYNQCQTQLKELYTKQDDNDKDAMKNQNEFIAFRLIYYVHQTGNKKYEGGSSDLFKIMLSLTPEQRADPSIAHALKVRAAVAEFDYHAFFQLKASCPNKHGVYLMDFMVSNVRHWGLQRMCKAYRPSVSLKFVLQELGFQDIVNEGIMWLESCGVVISQDEVVTKDSIVQESNLKAQNSLI